MIDWFLNLSWYWEIPVGIVVAWAALFLVWTTTVGFTLGVMTGGSGTVGAVGLLLRCVIGIIVAPFVMLYMIIWAVFRK